MCSTLASFLVILIGLVVTIYAARVLERLTTTVLFSCAHAEESFQIIKKRQNSDRLDDFKADLCPEQRVSVSSSLHQEPVTATKQAEGSSG